MATLFWSRSPFYPQGSWLPQIALKSQNSRIELYRMRIQKFLVKKQTVFSDSYTDSYIKRVTRRKEKWLWKWHWRKSEFSTSHLFWASLWGWTPAYLCHFSGHGRAHSSLVDAVNSHKFWNRTDVKQFSHIQIYGHRILGNADRSFNTGHMGESSSASGCVIKPLFQ